MDFTFVIRCIILMHSRFNLSYGGQNDVYTGNGNIASECALNFPSGASSSDKALNIAKATGWLVSDFVGLIPVVGGPAASAMSMVLHIHDLGQAIEDESEENAWETIEELFTAQWECTLNYVNTAIDENNAVLISSAITDRQQDFFNDFISLNAAQNNRDVIERYQDLVSDSIDDLVDAFNTNFPKTPILCRKYMPLIRWSMDAKILAYMNYYLATNDNTDSIEISEAQQVRFRYENGVLLKLYEECAPYSLESILFESNSLTLNDIRLELDLLYDGMPFCNWINITYQWTADIDGEQTYIFDNSEENDFSYWFIENECNDMTWMEYVTDTHKELYPENAYIGYTMSVQDLWSNAQSLALGKIHSWHIDKVSCNSCRQEYRDNRRDCDSKHYSKLTLIRNNQYSLLYGQKNNFYSFIDNLDSCPYEGCTGQHRWIPWNEITNKRTINFGCKLAHNKIITGLRFIIIYGRNTAYKNTQIAGFEAICSNVNLLEKSEIHVDEYYRSFRELYLPFTASAKDIEYSPWFICPPNYYVEFDTQIVTKCRENYSMYLGDEHSYYYAYTNGQFIRYKCTQFKPRHIELASFYLNGETKCGRHGEKVSCDNGLMTGACGSGTDSHCSKKSDECPRSENSWSGIMCHYSEFAIVHKSAWKCVKRGVQASCMMNNDVMIGMCGSKDTASCKCGNEKGDKITGILCGKLDGMAVVQERDCEWFPQNTWGIFKQCPPGKVMTGFCGSAAGKNCNGHAFEIQCCNYGKEVLENLSPMTCTKNEIYINGLTETLDTELRRYRFINGIVESIYSSNKADRKWKFKYCGPQRMIQLTNDEIHTLSVTEYDKPWERTCKRYNSGHSAIVQISSTYHNNFKDRKWTITCGDLNRDLYSLGNCQWMARPLTENYINDYGKTISNAIVCPNNGVIRDIYSIHDNGKEDRRWNIKCCTVKDS